MFELFKNTKETTAKPSLDDVDLHLAEIPEAVERISGYPRVNWMRVRTAVDRYANHPALSEIWTELAAQWLGVVAQHLGDPYQIYESEHFLALSAQGTDKVNRLLKIGDDAFIRLEQMLRQTGAERGLGKHVIFVFSSDAAYYDYVAYFYAESDREYGTSSGMHISRGYRHTVVKGHSATTLRTLVHELAHEMVFDRPLPRWLNEGLAQFMEDMVPGYRAPLIDGRQARPQRRYWSWFGMDHFWNGSGFQRWGSQRVSYQLSEILFRNLTSNRTRARQLNNFLATAHRDDAGLAACKRCFGCSLSALVEEFLGPGDWKPM